jgi:HSP20 family protein
MTPGGEESLGSAWSDRLWPEWSFARGKEFTPSFNMYEKEGSYYVTADLPGVNKEDLSIALKNNVLTISGKKESGREEKGVNYYLRESASGSFSRSFTLPGEVDADHVEAIYKDGVLTVVMPHNDSPQSRKIEIT